MDSSQIVFVAKLGALQRATFNLKYEEQLPQNENGAYSYEFVVDPAGEIIYEFDFQVNLKETRPLKDISVFKTLSSDGRSEDITTQSLTLDSSDPKMALVKDSPEQDGTTWKMVLKYDVDRPASGNEIQIAAGKFLHYFNPANIATEPKHIIFVIDVSGSMRQGNRLRQVQDAATTILDNMGRAKMDYFNIFAYNSQVEDWKSAIQGK